MKNNLFYYATSELSQDAFICWLASFALKGSEKDLTLKQCANHMLVLFVPELGKQEFTLTDVERQVQHVDVLLTVTSSCGTYKIIVEDKTFTGEHDNQLKRYLENTGKAFPDCKVRGVYYKTGFQSDLSAVKESGYTIITREQMLGFMKNYVSATSNQIFIDYYNYWNDFQCKTEQYCDLPVSQWDWKQVNGFYDYLKNSNFFGAQGFWSGYGYVANRNGGFHGLWFGSNDHRICLNGSDYELYLQMETSVGEKSSAQLCLKLSVVGTHTGKGAIRAARDSLIYADNREYTLSKYHFHKPSRLAIGQHMTIGVYDAPLHDYATMKDALHKASLDYIAFLQTL